MPTIQSKKYPDNIQYVTAETWAMMQDKGLARRFKVTDDSDLHDAIPAPTEIVDFNEAIEEEEGEPDRDEIKAKLDELGVEYRNNAPTVKLLDLLNETETKNQ